MKGTHTTVALAVTAWAALAAVAQAQAPLGASAHRIFLDRCSGCHADPENPTPRTGSTPAPTLPQLRPLTADAVFRSMAGDGAMVPHADGWNIDDRRRVAEFVTGKRVALAESIAPADGRCPQPAPPVDLQAMPLSNGWGVDAGNGRFQTADRAGLPAADIPKLTLKWAFGFPGTVQAWGQPTVAGGRVFIGTDTGVVYAIYAASGG